MSDHTESRLRVLEAALTELVRLKQIKRRLEAGEIYDAEQEDYALNKEAAWETAIRALAPDRTDTEQETDSEGWSKDPKHWANKEPAVAPTEKK